MTTSIALPALGLAVDQHPGLAPKGAMSQADNVVGDLPGVLRGRPNTFVSYSEDPVDPDDYARIDTLIRVGDEWLAHQGKDGPDAVWRNQNGVLTGIEAGAYPSTDDPADSAEARGSVYIGTDAGVAKLESASAQELLAAGVEMSIASEPFDMPKASSSVAGPFTSPFTVGYRLVVKREDVNGYVARSAPSMVFTPVDSGALTDASILLWGTAGDERWTFVPGSMRLGDVVEFYRTKIVTTSDDGPLAPDYYLVATYEISATDISNGYFPDPAGPEFSDTLADTQLGEALYTNPGREGALAARYTPPMCHAIESWSGVMWFGYVKERERVSFQLKSVGGGVETPTSLRSSDGQSLGVNTRTSTWSIGSPTVTVADISGIRVGQSIFSSTTLGPQSAGAFPAETTIVSISGAGPYSITASANALTAGAGGTLYYGDTVEVDGTVFYAGFATGTPDRTFGVSTETDDDKRAARAAYAFALVVNAWMAANDGEVRVVGPAPLVAVGLGGQVGNLTFESNTPGGQFTIGPSSALNAFSPAMNKELPIGATVRRNRLYWSQPDEPEAVQLLSYVDVGAEQYGILALSALHDALLVWKEDGLFRVTGSAPSSWSVDVVDASLVLSRSCAVDVLRGTAYAVTNRGVVSASEGGVVSLPAQGKVETLFRSPVVPRVVAWEQLGLVLFSDLVGQYQDTDYANTIYCLATATGVWSRWTNLWHSTLSGAGRDAYPFMAATRADFLPLFEVRRFLSDEGRGYDHAWETVAIDSRDGFTLVVTDAARGDWYPQVGDWLRFGAVLFVWGRVLEVDYDGFAGEWTLTLDRAVPGAEFATTLDAYEGAPVQLEWLPSVTAAGAAFTLPVWREVAFSFSNGPATALSQTGARLVFGARHDQSQTVPEVVATPQRAVAAMRPYRIGWPRNGARRSVVWPRLGFSEIAWSWRISGLSMTGEAGSERTRR
jgi:hypothetical protein